MDKFSYSKVWTNPADFPSVENSEEQVRNDLQLQPDEIKAYINGLVDIICGNSGAAELGCKDAAGATTTVQALLTKLDAVHATLVSLNNRFGAYAVSNSVNGDTDKVPTSAAVNNAITFAESEIGAGNMQWQKYDVNKKEEDIYAYTDNAVSTSATTINGTIASTKAELVQTLDTKYGTDDVIPVTNGGTGGNTKGSAKTGLGILSGSTYPEGGEDGDLYFYYG